MWTGHQFPSKLYSVGLINECCINYKTIYIEWCQTMLRTLQNYLYWMISNNAAYTTKLSTLNDLRQCCVHYKTIFRQCSVHYKTIHTEWCQMCTLHDYLHSMILLLCTLQNYLHSMISDNALYTKRQATLNDLKKCYLH